MQNHWLVSIFMFGSCAVVSPKVMQGSSPFAAAAVRTGAPISYSLNAVSPGATGPWSFFVSAAGETSVHNYLRVAPGIDAANIVRVVAETSPPYRPVMEWEYGYEAGLVTIRPESDRNVVGKKGDLIAMWAAPVTGRYHVQIDVDNVGNDARGGDGGTIILSRLGARESDDTHIIERVAIPASGFESPHVQRSVVIEAQAADRIVMRLNAGIDGFADLWRLRYVLTRADARTDAKTNQQPHAPH